MPTPFISDTLTDVNGTSLASHAPDIGGTWNKNFSSAGTDALVIQSNAASGNTTGFAFYNNLQEGPSANYTVTLDSTRLDNTTANFAEMIVRYVSAGQQYAFQWNGTQAWLARVDFVGSTGQTNLGTVSSTQALNTTYTFRGEVNGNVYKLYRNNVLLFTVTDAPTSPAMGTSKAVGFGGNNGYRFDNFTATDGVVASGVISSAGTSTVFGDYFDPFWNNAYLLDNFSKVGETGTPDVTAHSCSKGGPWVRPTQSNTRNAVVNGAGTANAFITGSDSATPAYYIDSTRTTINGVYEFATYLTGSSGPAIGMWRWRTSDAAHYELSITTTSVLLRRATGVSTTTTLATGSGVALTTYDLWRVVYTDNVITVYKNGIQFLTFTDTDPAALLGAGVVGFAASSGTLMDDFKSLSVAAIVSGVPASSGSCSAGFVGQALIVRSGAIASSGSSTALGVGLTTVTVNADSIGTSSGAFVGLTINLGVGVFSSTGSSSATAIGGGLIVGVFSAGGTSAGEMDSNSLAAGEGIGHASGTSLANFVGGSTIPGTFFAAGSSSASIEGEAVVGYVGSAAGTSTAAFVSSLPTPEDPVIVPATFAVFAHDTALFVGSFLKESEGHAAGTSFAIFPIVAIAAGAFNSTGTSTGNLVSTQIQVSTPNASGTSTAEFIAILPPASVMEANGTALVLGVGITIRVSNAGPSRTVAVVAAPRQIATPVASRQIAVAAMPARSIVSPVNNRIITL